MHMMFTPVLIACAATLASAQSPSASTSAAETEAILGVVQKFFDTMAARDVTEARRLMMPEARFFSVRDGIDQPALRTFSSQQYLEELAAQKQNLRERMWKPDVRVHGRIAVVWTPYDFWIDGKFSHCGVDAFDLVKTDEGWKISGGVYTVQGAGCEPSPLGPLKQP